MWQAEMRVDLDAIRDNVARLRAGTSAEVMAVVKADGYGHGMVPAARAALARRAPTGSACAPSTRRSTLRRAGITAPVLAWLLPRRCRCTTGSRPTSTSPLRQPGAAGRDDRGGAGGRAGRPGCTSRSTPGLSRGGATAAEWPALCEAAAKAQADGCVEVVGVWSHFVYADVPDHPTTDRQLAAFRDGLAVAERVGLARGYRHLANSAATLTRPDTHFDLVRPGHRVTACRRCRASGSGCGRR